MKLPITIFEISLVVIMPDITTNHAITYTNYIIEYGYYSELARNLAGGLLL